jgi:hypothetical protein
MYGEEVKNNDQHIERRNKINKNKEYLLFIVKNPVGKKKKP